MGKGFAFINLQGGLGSFFMPMHVFDGPAQKRPLMPPLRFNCVGGCMGLNPGLLRLWNWQSGALSTRIDLHEIEAISNVSKEVDEISSRVVDEI
jgi:hypothetical protein